MSLKLSTGDINKIYLGSTEIKKAYLGATLVYDKTATPNGLLNNLVSYYPFDGNVEDVHGSNNGTSYGTSDVVGKIDRGRGFDGNNDYVDLGSDDSLNFTDSFSFNVWVYNESTSGEKAIVTRYDYDSNKRQYYLQKNNGDFIFILGLNSGTSSQFVSTTYSVNKWTMLTCIYDDINNTQSIYKDGVLQQSSSFTASLIGFTQRTGIGQLMDTPLGVNWDGNIDEVGFWNKALSQAEITTLYNSGNGLEYGSFTL